MMVDGSTRQVQRVAHVGTGLTGAQALRAVIDDPALELVGLKVSTAEKVGVDAGRLSGGADVGIPATDDPDTIMALAPDCVLYCASAVRREEAAIADIVRYLEAGINVVTISTIPMVYPPAAPPEWREALQAAAVRGNSTFYATGAEPGFISLNIPTALLTGAGAVDSYRMDEYAIDLDKSYPIWDVLHESMGFGKPDGHVPARIAAGKVNHDWETVVRYIADILGLALDSVELDWETLLAPRRSDDCDRGDPARHDLRAPVAARRHGRRAPGRCGAVLRDGQFHTVAAALAASVAARPRRDGDPRPGPAHHVRGSLLRAVAR